MEEWSGWMEAAQDYVSEILALAGCQESRKIAERLVLTFPMHDYVINQEKARKIGLNVKDASEFATTWTKMRYWLGKYVLEQTATHLIRYALPSRPNEARRAFRRSEKP
jgi:hypothetical protein